MNRYKYKGKFIIVDDDRTFDTVAQAAAFCKISPATAYLKIKTGRPTTNGYRITVGDKAKSSTTVKKKWFGKAKSEMSSSSGSKVTLFTTLFTATTVYNGAILIEAKEAIAAFVDHPKLFLNGESIPEELANLCEFITRKVRQ